MSTRNLLRCADEALKNAGVLCTDYRRNSIDDIFTGVDIKANTSQQKNIIERMKSGVYCFPLVGHMFYRATHIEMFVPAGHVGFLMNEKNEYLFMQPGMHNIRSCGHGAFGHSQHRGHRRS